MSNSIITTFKVADGGLANYIESIKKKSQDLTNDAIKSALAQSDAGKNQIKIINEQIAAIERKTRIETQAARSIALEQRQSALKNNTDHFDARKNEIFSNKKLSEGDKKEKINALSWSEGAGNEKIKGEYRDTLTVLKEQEKQSKLQTILSKQQLDAIKQTARENVTAISVGDKKLEEIFSSATTDEELLVARLTKEGIIKEKKGEKDEDNPKTGLFGELLAVDNLKHVISAGGQLAQTQNGFDLIQPAANTFGRIAGGILGGVIAAVFSEGIGTLTGAALGAEIGGGVGSTFGAFEQREAMLKENYYKSAFRYRAITGSLATEGENTEESGVDSMQYLALRGEFARRRGYSNGSDKTTKDAIYLDKGLGIEHDTSAAIIDMQRSTNESNRGLAELIGGIMEKGKGSIFPSGDNTFLNEFTSKFVTLQKELLKSSTTISTGITMDILKQFNSAGGMLDARDPRSGGIINSIQGSLSNPDSDNTKALEFAVLRRQNPGMGIFALREEMQKGLGSPGLLKGMLEQVDKFGGSDDAKMNQLSGLFKGVPLQAIESIWKGYRGGKFSKFDTNELKGVGLSDDVLRGMSDNNTTNIEKQTAKLNNAILSDNGIKAMADALDTAVKAALSGAVIEMADGNKIKLGGKALSTPMRVNTTKDYKQPNETNNVSEMSPENQALLYSGGR